MGALCSRPCMRSCLQVLSFLALPAVLSVPVRKQEAACISAMAVLLTVALCAPLASTLSFGAKMVSDTTSYLAVLVL